MSNNDEEPGAVAPSAHPFKTTVLHRLATPTGPSLDNSVCVIYKLSQLSIPYQVD